MTLVSLFNFLEGNSGVSKSSLNYIKFNKKIINIYLPQDEKIRTNNKLYKPYKLTHKILGPSFSTLFKIIQNSRKIIIDGNSAAIYLLILVFKIHICCLLKREKSIKLYLRTHNVDIDVRFTLLKKIITFISEFILYRLVDSISAVSLEDKNKIKKYYNVEAIIIPNKTNLFFTFKKYDNKFDFKYITFNGSTNYGPNNIGLKFIYNNILDTIAKKNIFIVHCGDSSNFNLNHNNLLKYGNCSDDDFYSILSHSLVNLVPIEYGGGTKIKLIESIILGIPTLAFNNLNNNMYDYSFNPIYCNKSEFLYKLINILDNYDFYKNKAILNAESYKKSIEISNKLDF